MKVLQNMKPPPLRKSGSLMKKRRGRKRRIVQRFKLRRLFSPLRRIKARSGTRWDGPPPLGGGGWLTPQEGTKVKKRSVLPPVTSEQKSCDKTNELALPSKAVFLPPHPPNANSSELQRRLHQSERARRDKRGGLEEESDLKGEL